MKILLTQFVKGLGKAGDIVEVSDGYAVNALFPKKLAKPATGKIVNTYLTKKKSEELRKEKEKKAVLDALAKIDGQVISFQERANGKGKLYHTLGLQSIQEEIEKQYQVKIPERFFTQAYAFKEVGEYPLEIEAYGKRATLMVKIIAD